MKRFVFLHFLVSLCLMGNANALDASLDYSFVGDVVCATVSQCLENTSLSLPCCCPKNGTGVVTMYECPVGWRYFEALAMCARANSNGDDASGYYTQEYGSCEPMGTIQNTGCYVLSASDTSTSVSTSLCYCNESYGGNLS